MNQKIKWDNMPDTFNLIFLAASFLLATFILLWIQW